MARAYELAVSPRATIHRDPAEDAAERVFIVTGVTTPDAAKAQVLADFPTAGAVTLGENRVLRVDHWDVELLESDRDDTWLTVAVYDADISTIDLPAEYSFDTTGGTHHITHALSAVTFGGSASDDPGTAINVDEDGNVEGVDIVVPIGAWTESYVFSEAQMGMAHRQLIHHLTGTMNSEPFRGTKPFETLFMGATGRADASGDWSITFQFAYSPETELSVKLRDQDEPFVFTKRGWDYVSVRNGKQGGQRGIVPVIDSVTVARVYRTADHNLLFLGKEIGR